MFFWQLSNYGHVCLQHFYCFRMCKNDIHVCVNNCYSIIHNNMIYIFCTFFVRWIFRKYSSGSRCGEHQCCVQLTKSVRDNLCKREESSNGDVLVVKGIWCRKYSNSLLATLCFGSDDVAFLSMLLVCTVQIPHDTREILPFVHFVLLI